MSPALDLAPAYAFRPLAAEDRAFVLSSWLRSYRYGSSFGRSFRNAEFFPGHHDVAERVLARSSTVVAHLPDSPGVILGFLVHEPAVLHYVYVKEQFRRLGIAWTLLAAAHLPAAFRYTHATDDWQRLRSRFPSASYLGPYGW